jgi:hypothetical protein
MKMITKQEYNKLKKQYDFYQSERERLFLGRNRLDKEMQAQLPESCTNDEISSIEVYEFVNNPPDKYFGYIKTPEIGNMGEMITWTGENLGSVLLWNTWRSNFGDTRVSIDVWGINGIKYHGFYYKSAGDYCRIQAYKNQE